MFDINNKGTALLVNMNISIYPDFRGKYKLMLTAKRADTSSALNHRGWNTEEFKKNQEPESEEG